MSEKRDRARRAMMAGLEPSDSYSSSDSDTPTDDLESSPPVQACREPVVRRLLDSWDKLYPFMKKSK